MRPRLYLTRVMHRRRFPVAYRFDYPVFSLLLDIDRLDETFRTSRLLKVDRFGLLSFRRRDHGARDGTELRPWAIATLKAQGIEIGTGKIHLLCFPRLLGYGFSPLSVWYCLDQDERLRAVIAEVRNTFGQHHSYLLHNDGRPMNWPARAEKDKVFHVSPLIDMDCAYRFRFAQPGERLSVVIEQFQQDKHLLTAAQTGRGLEINDRNLLRALLRTPLMSFKVMWAIHWQALKIWLRGARFHAKPPLPTQEIT